MQGLLLGALQVGREPAGEGGDRPVRRHRVARSPALLWDLHETGDQQFYVPPIRSQTYVAVLFQQDTLFVNMQLLIPSQFYERRQGGNTATSDDALVRQSFFLSEKKILIVSLQVGMLTLMSAVLKHNPVFKHQPEGQVFVATLFEFLFKLPSSQVLVLRHFISKWQTSSNQKNYVKTVIRRSSTQCASRSCHGQHATTYLANSFEVVLPTTLPCTSCLLHNIRWKKRMTTKDGKYYHDDLSGGQSQVVPLGVLAQGGGSQRMRPRGSPQPGSHLLHGDGRPAALHDPSDEGVYTARRRTRSNRPHLWQTPVHSL